MLDGAVSAIQKAAPQLTKLLRSLDRPKWARNQAEEADLQPRHLLMLSMMCTFLRRKTCTNLPTLFGIYLLDSGATKRVLNTCNRLGICMSYSQHRKKQLEMAKQAEGEVRELGPGPAKLILLYDNFEYQDSKAEELMASATQRPVTDIRRRSAQYRISWWTEKRTPNFRVLRPYVHPSHQLRGFSLINCLSPPPLQKSL